MASLISGYSLLVPITILSPCWAYFLWRIRSNSQSLYVLGSTAIWTATTYLAYYPTRMVEGLSYYLSYYGIFCLICILLYGIRYNFRQFPKVLALTVFTLFIAGDLWEIPEFLCDFLFRHGGLIDTIWLASQIRRVYTVAAFVLFQKLSGFSFNRLSIAIFACATILSFIFLFPPDNMKLLHGWELSIISRVTYIPLFTLVGYLGVRDG